jgi:hypothetical protein
MRLRRMILCARSLDCTTALASRAVGPAPRSGHTLQVLGLLPVDLVCGELGRWHPASMTRLSITWTCRGLVVNSP